MTCCDTCAYMMYDDEYEEYFCSADVDEDEYYRLTSGSSRDCPFYRDGDEYAVVKKQN